MSGQLVESTVAPTVADAELQFLHRRKRHLLGRGHLMRRALLAADVVGLTAAFMISLAVMPNGPRTAGVGMAGEAGLFLISIPIWVLLLKLYGLYTRDGERTDHSTVDDVRGIFEAVTIGTWLYVLFGFVTGLTHTPLLRTTVFWLSAILLVSALRVVARAICRLSPQYMQNALILGAGSVGQHIGAKIVSRPQYGMNLVGFVDDRPRTLRSDLNADGSARGLLGTPDDLLSIIRRHDVDRVIVAFSSDNHDRMLELIRTLRTTHVQIDIVPRFFDALGTNLTVHTLDGMPLVGLAPDRLSRSSLAIKRGLDLSLATMGLALISPVLLMIAAAVKLTSNGPVLFKQVRMGADEQLFQILKFRTMYADAEARKADVAHLNMHALDDPRMFKVPDDPRITPLGRFLRRYSLDELPQLLNVVRGEMSLVGPRPLILEEDYHVVDWARERLSLRPGITGPWQVLGASEISFDEMTRLDYLYVRNWSLSQDLRLLMLTLRTVFRAKSAY